VARDPPANSRQGHDALKAEKDRLQASLFAVVLAEDRPDDDAEAY
jgi:hypothetical protein